MIKVITIESEYDSACRLRYPEVIKETPYTNECKNDLIIRWGLGDQSYSYNESTGNTEAKEYDRVINCRDAIRLNCHKPVALAKLSTVVRTPEMWREGEQVPSNQIVVYRRTHHSGGNGFKVQTGPFEVGEDHYATSWIPSQIEYRVWFCGERTMYAMRTKLPSQIERKYPCRSLWGYTFFNKRIPHKLHIDTVAAAKVIGLDCGAADILSYKGQYYFLELNSAATIDKQVIEDFYTGYIPELIKKKYPDFK